MLFARGGWERNFHARRGGRLQTRILAETRFSFWVGSGRAKTGIWNV